MKRLGIIATAIAVTGITTGVAIADPPAGPQSQRPKLAALPSGIESVFGVFATPAGPQDAVPARLADVLAQGPPAWLGVNPALSKRIGSTWLMPGTDSLCVVNQLTGSERAVTISCAEHMADAASGVAVASATNVAGAVPNGVRRVKISTKAGLVRATVVRRNMFAAKVKGARFVRYTLHGKTHKLNLGG